MFVTELVSHPEMSALNDDARANIYAMSVTELVSHPEMSALNADVEPNMYPMFVTELVSHPEMSALNDDAKSNIPYMSVTELVFQSGISWQPATPHRRSATHEESQDASCVLEQHAMPVGS
jgi:hypothetical protein